jgi:hypothetical protein
MHSRALREQNSLSNEFDFLLKHATEFQGRELGSFTNMSFGASTLKRIRRDWLCSVLDAEGLQLTMIGPYGVVSVPLATSTSFGAGFTSATLKP